MKNFLKTLLLSCMMIMLLAVPAMAEDAVSSASVADFYADAALTGDDLMNAINAFSGTYLVATTNPDGTPNMAFFVFSMVKHEDQYYLQLGLAENQSKVNLAAGSEGVAIFGANPDVAAGDKPYPVAGARIFFKALEDPSLAEVLNTSGRPGAMFFEITEIRPVG